jgi:hypothetical protein
MHHAAHHHHISSKSIAGGSMAETIGGAGGLTLAILGLAGVFPMYMAAIGTIGVGAGLLLQGISIAARYADIQARTAEDRAEQGEISSGVTMEMLGGAAGVALGILALLGVYPITLLAAAAIAFGGTLLFGSGAQVEMREISGTEEDMRARRLTARSVEASGGIQVLVGIGSVALGILALVGIAPLPLILVAVLSCGASALLSGGALTSRMMSVLRH